MAKLDWKYNAYMREWIEREVSLILALEAESPQSPAEIKKYLLTFRPEGAEVTMDTSQGDYGSFKYIFGNMNAAITVSYSIRGSKYDNVSLNLNICGYSCSTNKYYYGKDDTGVTVPGLLRLIERLPDIWKMIPEKEAYYEGKQAESVKRKEKRAKTKEVRAKSAVTWLNVIMGELKYPYLINEMSLRIDLIVQMPDKTELELQIPIKSFEKVLPGLQNIINEYFELHKKQGVKVLISNSTHTEWIQPKN
ncbi:MAG: hypothetical protein LBS62_14870 [Clostridiales bacterium]|jgi:hypothetical protein|nr:hypothetical protein [Clostridiales bacterium]